MDNEQYAFVLGALARIDKKLDILIGINQADFDDDEFEEEFDI